jgi:hypothetical protein
VEAHRLGVEAEVASLGDCMPMVLDVIIDRCCTKEYIPCEHHLGPHYAIPRVVDQPEGKLFEQLPSLHECFAIQAPLLQRQCFLRKMT